MGALDISLERIYRQLTTGNVGRGIAEMETYLAAWPNPQTSQKLADLKSEYALLEDYWLRGVKDPLMEEQYQHMLQRLYTLFANIAIHRHLQASSYLQGIYNSVRTSDNRWTLDAIRQEMEGFVSDTALLELEPEDQRKEKRQALYKHHQQQMNALFNYLLTSHIWTAGIGRDMEQLLLSPTIDSIDQQLLISAITLSLMNRFDWVKFRLLVNVYRQAVDQPVRQRALVGWALSIDDNYLAVFPEMRTLVAELLQSEEVCRELTELQIQLVYTLDQEKVTTTFQEEIMPGLMKNNGFRITKDGIEEVDDDPMEDILHPGASEERMEKLESTYRRMIDLEKQGADIYFSGFSQMKRFPFFYDMSNWLVPFFIDHPDISAYLSSIGENRFMEKLLIHRPFCNSDKYSLVMVFQQVMNRLPSNLIDILKRGEAELDDEEAADMMGHPFTIRRGYLMDLYRFFRLFPNRAALFNPFDERKQEAGMCLFFASAVFQGTPLEAHKREVVTALLKHKMGTVAQLLLDTFDEEQRDVQYYLWRKDYERALELAPDNERALAGQARRLFAAQCFAEAEDCYDRLQLLHPEKTGYVLNKAVCLVRQDDYEEALKLLFQLNYEHDDDNGVLRVLAWTLTCCGRVDQAIGHYRQLMERVEPTAEDYQNQGYCLWLMGQTTEAAESFRKSIEKSQSDVDEASLFDKAWLAERGISDMDVKMMLSKVKN